MKKLNYNHTMKCCFMAYITSAIINNITPLLFITFQREFGISLSEIGLIVSLNFIIQMFIDYLGARFADKFGYRMTILFALVFAAGGMFSLSILPYVMNPYAGIMCSVVLYAVGSGMIEVMVSPTTEALPIKGKEAAMNLMHSFYCWGHVLVVVVSTVFFVKFGVENWRYLMRIWAAVPAFTFILFTVVPIYELESDGESGSLRSLFSQKGFAVFFAVMICAGASELSMSQWASYFAEEGLGVSKTVGDLLGPCMFAVLMGISRVMYSKLADRLKLDRYIVFCGVLCVVTYLVASLCKNPVLALAGCAVCGFSVGVMWPGTLSLAAKSLEKKTTAMFAVLALGGDIGCFIGPEAVAIGSSLFSVGGSSIKAGILCACVFPVLLMCSVAAIRKSVRKSVVS